MQIGKLDCHILSAGTWKGDGGATMGVLPKPLWQKLISCDDKNRVTLALNLLLIQAEGKNILIDTGIGNKISDKVRKIFDPSPWELLENLAKLGLKRTDIDYVILTHLHFDHAGGVAAYFDGNLELTFPEAVHIIQTKEWEIAAQPDELNRGSYNFADDLQLLSEKGKIRFIDGEYELLPGIRLELTGGHSEGMQIVWLESEGKIACYAGDIIPMDAHTHLAVNSAFDLNRQATFLAKKRILTRLQETNGILFFAHDTQKSVKEFRV
ncbi:MAG TPA: MBL fold metallo-hydrolase [Candidatus Cloacimonadota bacterium]|nr:MBL fold metallo-hydrolase [Candidatus Cloacimonadota bacterium]